ncbi:MAG TPA: decaprenyl-phosphate phosphoribosyltransferase [Longilinea sp.]|nr:decaprenyl-phosphate phosphoribosyltransferase [Longilinea sp.]
MLKAILKTMRPTQWTKNVFLLAALVFDRQITIFDSLARTLAGFFLFCLLSSAIYVFNDLIDAPSDRNHPKKRYRPIASGQLSERAAIITLLLLLAIILPLASLLSWGFFAICVTYLLLNIAYSRWLKHVAILDVFIIASGFVLRVAAGVTLIHVERFSPWLFVITTLFALYIGFGKRRSELVLLAGDANLHRRVLEGYTIPFLDQLLSILSATTIMAYSLYTFSAPNLPNNDVMMLTIPFVMYGIFRYLYLIHVKNAGGAPEDLVLTDRPLQIVVVLWGVAVLLIFYIF